MRKNVIPRERKSSRIWNALFKNATISKRIIGLFLIVIIISIGAVAGTVYYVGRVNVENITKNQMKNSVNSVIDQISLLTGAYSSKQFPEKLGYLLAGQKASFTEAGLDAELFLFDSSGNGVSVQGSDSLSLRELPRDFTEQAFQSRKGNTDISFEGKSNTITYGYIMEKDWVFAIAVTRASYLKPVFAMQRVTIAVGIISVLVAFFMSLLGTRGIIRAIKQLNKTVSRADGGDLTVRASVGHGGKEITALAEDFNAMLSNFCTMLGEMGYAIDSLTELSKGMSEISAEFDESSSQLHEYSQEVSAGSEEQKDFIQAAGESAQDIVSLVNKITSRTNSASVESDVMLETVNRGIQFIYELTGRIQEMEKASSDTEEHVMFLNTKLADIGEITRAIKAVSEQTKLLALNASIEAAKAGVHGAGFGVVAREIQNLARDSAKSAFAVDEIIKAIEIDTKQLLSISRDAAAVTREGSEIAGSANMVMDSIVLKVGETHDSIAVISDMIGGISRSVEVFEKDTERNLKIVEEMSEGSQKVASMAESSYRLSGDISESAVSLSEVASKLKAMKDKIAVSS